MNPEEKKWMDDFDFACMVYFSITDAFTSFGITILFYQIGKNEYAKSNEAKIISLRSKEDSER
jgi:hypothetical protein